MKKKTLSVLLILVMIVSLCSCGAPSPTETTTAFLQAVKNQDSEALAKVYAGEPFTFSELLTDDADAGLDEMEEYAEMEGYLNDTLIPKLLEFDYEVLNESIEGEKAFVDVKITTYELGNALTSFFGDYISQAFTLALGGASEETLEALAVSTFKEKVNAMEKTYTKEIKIPLTLVDDAWVVGEADDESPLLDSITGGMMSAADQLEDTF